MSESTIDFPLWALGSRLTMCFILQMIVVVEAKGDNQPALAGRGCASVPSLGVCVAPALQPRYKCCAAAIVLTCDCVKCD